MIICPIVSMDIEDFRFRQLGISVGLSILGYIDIDFSNSSIEAWWRVLKYQWVFLNTLDDMTTLRPLVAILNSFT